MAEIRRAIIKLVSNGESSAVMDDLRTSPRRV
jgi:hypothetical protein